jgi:hypothetical protein
MRALRWPLVSPLLGAAALGCGHSVPPPMVPDPPEPIIASDASAPAPDATPSPSPTAEPAKP